jgi:hypothetical protein
LSANRYLPAAQNVAQAIPGILAEQGLDPLISRFVLTETEQGDAWLFVVMDDSVLESLESYAATSVLSHLSAALHGHLVLFSNSYGLRYAVLLSPSKNLPKASPLSNTPFSADNIVEPMATTRAIGAKPPND